MHGESNDDVNGNGNLLLSMLTSVDMYALNACTPPQFTDAHLEHISSTGPTVRSWANPSLTTSSQHQMFVAMPRDAAAGPTATVGHKLVSSYHMPVLATIQSVLVKPRTACEKSKMKLASLLQFMHKENVS
jgi:hypothetical protein